MYKVNNAIIMAAGTSSRFAPLSYEMPKALIEVKGEVLIERQIKQLLNVGIKNVYIVTGYKSEMFEYLTDKYGVKLIHNPDYLIRNNNASIWVARHVLGNTYVCSADNYFRVNPFESDVKDAYYSAVYSNGVTAEWCMDEDEEGNISNVTVGGSASWYMLGHTFWSESFSNKFIEILEKEYNLPATKDKLWEKIFIEHLDELKMKIRKYEGNVVFEFDTLDELRVFDASYNVDTRSSIIKNLALEIGCKEADIIKIVAIKNDTAEAVGFEFECIDKHYQYFYETKSLLIID